MKGSTITPRAVCARCRRPPDVCVCALLPALSPSANVLILQHPKERRVAIGTAKMAARCLEGARVVVGTELDAHPLVVRTLSDPERKPILLWPGPDAIDLAASPPKGRVSLLVVDGTWSTAKTLLKKNPRIAALPRYAISPAAPSEYDRIRKEPRAECLSTLEAIAAALSALEGEPDRYAAMLAPLRAMVDGQLRRWAGAPKGRDRSRLEKKRRKVWSPPAAFSDPARVVIVAVETNAWPADRKEGRPDEIVQWLAVRGDGSESLDLVARPTKELAPSVTRHTELAADVLLNGVPRGALLAAVRAFLREGDVLATWGTYATRMMRDAGLLPAIEVVELRRATSEALRGSPGSIERCVERLGLGARVIARGRGRGGRRLGHMVAVFEMLARRGANSSETSGPTLGSVAASRT